MSSDDPEQIVSVFKNILSFVCLGIFLIFTARGYMYVYRLNIYSENTKTSSNLLERFSLQLICFCFDLPSGFTFFSNLPLHPLTKELCSILSIRLVLCQGCQFMK